MKVSLFLKNEQGKREENIFTTNHVSGKHFRKVNEFDETIDYSDIGTNNLDELVGFVCDVFDNQFTVDQFYDGIPSQDLIPTITDVFVYVRTGKTPQEIEEEQKESDKGNETGE